MRYYGHEEIYCDLFVKVGKICDSAVIAGGTVIGL